MLEQLAHPQASTEAVSEGLVGCFCTVLYWHHPEVSQDRNVDYGLVRAVAIFHGQCAFLSTLERCLVLGMM